jgi:hypothetical protein
MNIILFAVYFLLLIVALIFAGAIVYHMLTYSREDLSIEYVRSAQRNLIIYLVSSGAVLISSIVGAIILFFMLRI